MSCQECARSREVVRRILVAASKQLPAALTAFAVVLLGVSEQCRSELLLLALSV